MLEDWQIDYLHKLNTLGIDFVRNEVMTLSLYGDILPNSEWEWRLSISLSVLDGLENNTKQEDITVIKCAVCGHYVDWSNYEDDDGMCFDCWVNKENLEKMEAAELYE